MLRLSSKFDFELPRSQGKNEDVVSYISIGVRKEETHRLLRGSLGEGRSVMVGWCPQHPCPCALKEFPRQFFMPRVGASQERDIGKQLADDAASLDVPSPNTAILGVRASTYEFWGTGDTNIRSITARKWPSQALNPDHLSSPQPWH